MVSVEHVIPLTTMKPVVGSTSIDHIFTKISIKSIIPLATVLPVI